MLLTHCANGPVWILAAWTAMTGQDVPTYLQKQKRKREKTEECEWKFAFIMCASEQERERENESVGKRIIDVDEWFR